MKRLLAVGATPVLALALVLGSAVQSAQAAPLDSAEVAAGAKWFFHVDFDAARSSKVGEYIHAKALKDEHVKKALAKMEEELGFDPQKDLHGATLYGTTFEPHTGVLIVHATADKAKLMNQLKKKHDFIALKTADGNHEIYTWTEHMGRHPASAAHKDGAKKGPEHKAAEHTAKPHLASCPMGGAHGAHGHMGHGFKHTVWAAFPKHGVAVFADSAANLAAALNVIGGKGGLSSSSTLLPKAPKGTVFSGAVEGLGGAHLPARLPVVKQIASISFVAGETDGEDFDHIKVTMTGDEVTKQVKSIIEGFQAMGALQLSGHPEALKMVNGLKAEANGKVLEIDWKASSGDLIKFGEKACQFIRQHHQAWHHGQADGKPPVKSGKKAPGKTKEAAPKKAG